MLAGIAFEPKDPIDDLLAGIADAMLANGKSVAGYVQKRRKDADCGTLVHVRNLRSGDEMPITKNRGKMAKGCKLDGDVGVRDEYRAAWDAFHGGYADALALNTQAIENWLSQTRVDTLAV